MLPCILCGVLTSIFFKVARDKASLLFDGSSVNVPQAGTFNDTLGDGTAGTLLNQPRDASCRAIWRERCREDAGPMQLAMNASCTLAWCLLLCFNIATRRAWLKFNTCQPAAADCCLAWCWNAAGRCATLWTTVR
jgi:hypothetical protein